jgi:hypothetical protein
VFLWLANWWDNTDLWLSQLAFPFQFAIVIAVLAPVCVGLAWVIDHVVDLVPARLTRTREIKLPEVPTPVRAVTLAVRADMPPGTPGTIISVAPPVTAGRGTENTGS